MSARSDVNARSEQQMIDYGVRMRKERDALQAEVEALRERDARLRDALLAPTDMHAYTRPSGIHAVRECVACRVLADLFGTGPLAPSQPRRDEGSSDG